MDKLKCELIQIFPINIWKIKINRTAKEKASLNKKIKLIQKENEGQTKSNYGGYHSPLFRYYDLIGTEFEFLYKNILYMMNNFIIPREKTKLKSDMKKNTLIEENIGAMWFIINKKGDFNHKHCHPPAWYAGAYYVKKPKNSGDIIFHDAIPERRFDDTSIISTNVESEEGDLILFPGWLEHSVKKSETNKDRIVISFNISRPDYVRRF